MAFRTLADIVANNETQSELVTGLVQKYLQSNEYIAWADTVITDRPSIKVNSVVDYGTVQKGMDCNSEYTSVAISGASSQFDLVKYGTQFETCLDVVGLGSTFVDQAAEDLAGAVKRMANEISIDAITGSGTGEIFGLNSLVTNSVAASAVGGVGSIESLWYLFDAVKSKSAKMAILCNARTKRAILSELLGAASVGTAELKGTSFAVPTFNGASILVNDAMTNGDVVLLNGDPTEGIFPVIGEFPSQKLGLFNYLSVGINQSKDTEIYRLNAHVTHVKKSNDAAAKITGFVA